MRCNSFSAESRGLTFPRQLLQHLQSLDERRRPALSKGEPLENATFESLSVRLQVPYWLMHSGNCEHFVVIEEIRYSFCSLSALLRLTLEQFAPPK